MTPIELFHEARLAEAIAAQSSIVAAKPENIAERLLLCDLLAFNGDRAAVRQHLDRLAEAPTEVAAYIAEWQELLAADESRHAQAEPRFCMKPPRHALRRVQAMRRLISGDGDVLDLLDDADEDAAWLEGFVDGRPFEGWRDSDDLLGTILEVFENGQFAWLPLEQIRKLRLEKIESLRDELYRPATVWLADNSTHELFIPSLYVGTHEHPEEGIRTGAGIDWTEQASLMRGLGARTFLFGEEELSLQEFTQVEIRVS